MTIRPASTPSPAGGAARRVAALARRMLLPLLGGLGLVYFGGQALAGQNGLLALSGYRSELTTRRAELARLQAEKARLQHRSTLLDPRAADPDLADELARRDLGLIRPDEVIVPLD